MHLTQDEKEKIDARERSVKNTAASLIAMANVSPTTKTPDEWIQDDDFKWAFYLTLQIYTTAFVTRVLHYCDTFRAAWNSAASSGFPFAYMPRFKELWKRLEDAYKAGLIPSAKRTFSHTADYMYECCRPIVHSIGEAECTFYTLLGRWLLAPCASRKHMVDFGTIKSRTVIMVPFLIKVMERMIFSGWIWSLRSISPYYSPLLWGGELARGGARIVQAWANAFRFANANRRVTAYFIDFSSFDASVSSILLVWFALAILESLDIRRYYSSKDYADAKCKPSKIRRIVWCLIAFMLHSLITMGEWAFLPLNRLLRSGSLLTMPLGSMIHTFYVIFFYTKYYGRMTLREWKKRVALKVQSDDGILLDAMCGMEGEDFMQKFSELLYEWFGARVNLEKSCWTTNRGILFYFKHTIVDGVPYPDMLKNLIPAFLNPEYFATPSKWMMRCINFALLNRGLNERLHNALHDVYRFFEAKGYLPDESDYLRRHLIDLCIQMGMKSVDASEYVNSLPSTLFEGHFVHFPDISEVREIVDKRDDDTDDWISGVEMPDSLDEYQLPGYGEFIPPWSRQSKFAPPDASFEDDHPWMQLIFLEDEYDGDYERMSEIRI